MVWLDFGISIPDPFHRIPIGRNPSIGLLPMIAMIGDIAIQWLQNRTRLVIFFQISWVIFLIFENYFCFFSFPLPWWWCKKSCNITSTLFFVYLWFERNFLFGGFSFIEDYLGGIFSCCLSPLVWHSFGYLSQDSCVFFR